MADGGRSLEDIGRRLKALRESLGMNQSAFAVLCGVSAPAINNYEQAIRRPELDVALVIRARTGATLDWIYEGERGGLPGHLLERLPELSEQAPRMPARSSRRR